MKKNIFKKIFNKLTLRFSTFDLLTLLIGFLFIGFIGLFFLRKMEWKVVYIKVSPEDFFWSEKNPPYWLVNSVQVGDAERDGLGREVVKVLDVRSYEKKEQSKSLFLKTKLYVVFNKRKNQYFFRSRPIGVGSPIQLQLSSVYLRGVVIDIEGLKQPREWQERIVEANVLKYSESFPETTGIQPWETEAIKIGAKMKDSQNRVVAEVIDKQVMPAKKIVVTDNGRVLLAHDPIKKDLKLVVRLKTHKENNVDYFIDEYKIKVNSSFPLFLPNIDIWPTVTKIIN